MAKGYDVDHPNAKKEARCYDVAESSVLRNNAIIEQINNLSLISPTNTTGLELFAEC